MEQSSPAYNPSGAFHRAAAKLIEFALQPLIIVGVLALWMMNRDMDAVYPITILAVQVLLGVLERWMPARPQWLQKPAELLRNLGIVAVVVVITQFVAMLYSAVLADPLAAARSALNLDIWPHQWPLLVQVLLVFLLSEFMWYWLHRAEHRWYPVWRISGHGAHHAFKHLGAINFGANHPLETFFLVLPAALVELLFGVGTATIGAAILTVTQASIAHTNLHLNTRGIGWLFTTNRYHIRHHSAVLAESNTNYGCAAIVWDRLFGTFADSDIAEAGSGPTEPGLWAKFMMPLREPADTRIAPG